MIGIGCVVKLFSAVFTYYRTYHCGCLYPERWNINQQEEEKMIYGVKKILMGWFTPALTKNATLFEIVLIYSKV